MGAKFVAAIVGVIILVVLAQTFIFGGGDGSPSANRPSSIPTATPPADQGEPVLLGEGQAGGGSGDSSSSGASSQSTYVVQSGDTLGAIAVQLGIPSDEQAAWIAKVLDLNGMEDARQLQVGQELILPAQAGASASPSNDSNNGDQSQTQPSPTAPPSATGTAATPTPSASSSGGSSGVYVVEDGDNPYVIALKHCVDDPTAWAQELLDINGVDATNLSVGQELDLPPGTPPFCGDQATPTSDGGT